MTTSAAKKVKAKRARRPIYLRVARLVDPATGEDVGALVPANPVDSRLLRERRFTVNREIRAEMKQPRNAAFHRLAHVLGHLLVDNVEEFRDVGSHEALKRVQLEANVACDIVEMDASPVIAAILNACESLLGAGAKKVLAAVLPDIKTIPVKVARSIAFDEMDEDEFHVWFVGITSHIAANYLSVQLDEVREEFWQIVNGRNS